MKTNLVKLDKLLVNRKFVKSKIIAQEYIKSGRVFVDGIKVLKIASQVPSEISIKIDLPEKKWVSRGAFKLLRALDVFKVSPKGKECVDIGASTGGFTDVLLSRGANQVYAIDVGYGQLAWKLRNDNRVVVLERTNAKFLTIDMLNNKKMDIIVSDASFISIRLLLKPLEKLLKDDGIMIVLLKPQFEVSKDKVGKGVVTDHKLHSTIIDKLINFIDKETKMKLLDITYSPIRGPEGNIEFLLYLCLKESVVQIVKNIDINAIVLDAHKNTEFNNESRAT